jgi:hypothetical protein
MSKFKFKTSDRIQKLANSKDGIADIADIAGEDCSDDVGSYIEGVTDGIDLVLKNPKAKFWLVTYSDYCGGDGIAIFVGLEKEVLQRISKLTDRDEDDGDD